MPGKRFKGFTPAEVVELVNALALHMEVMKTYSPADEYEIDIIADMYKEASKQADEATLKCLIESHEGTEH